MSLAPERRIFLVNVADLLRRPGSHRDVAFSAPIPAVTVVETSIPPGATATVALRLESLSDGLTVMGTLATTWTGLCRRCLEPAEGDVHADVSEVFSAHPVNDEVWSMRNDQLDLFALVTETLTLELPLAPLCRADCAGLCSQCGANLNLEDCRHARPGVS